MDKKAAEDQARLAKEATGRAMFETGEWEASGDEGDEGESDDEEEGGDEGDDAWNMEKLRQETEALREKTEAERIAGFGQGSMTNGVNGVLGHTEPGTSGTDEEGEAS